jgi:hypothetical protein
MRRLILAAALWPLMGVVAQASCPTTLTDCPSVNAKDGNFGGKITAPGISWLAAVDYGVKADAVIDATTGALISGSSDDVALKAAIDDCAAKHTVLVLPPRPMLLDGSGSTTTLIRNCIILGTGPAGGIYSEPKLGSILLLTSTTVKPFYIRSDWVMQGVTFYHPNQVGAGAKFTGSVSGSNLTVTGVTNIGGTGAGIKPGYLLTGKGVPLQTTITSQTSGTTGGNGVYVLNKSFSASAPMAVAMPPIAYPCVLNDDGVHGASHFTLDRVTMINPYDAICGTNNVGWGAFFITNSQMWALHDTIAPGYIGDTARIGPMVFSPGPWFNITGTIEPTLLMLNWGGQNNSIFVAKGLNLPWQVTADPFGAQSYRYAFKVENTGVNFSQSLINIAGDAVGTVLSVPEGSTFGGHVTAIRGSAGCNIVDWITNTTLGPTNCFEINSTSSLVLDGFLGHATGNLVVTNGGNVQINGGRYSSGSIMDNGDYALVKLTANVAQISIDGAYSQGVACSESATQCLHARGVDAGTFDINGLQVQNSTFLFYENAFKLAATTVATITGNVVNSTEPSAGNALVTTAATGSITSANNTFDIGPASTVSACGGAGATITGALNGWVVPGSTTTNVCTITMPYKPASSVMQAWAADGTAVTVQQLSATQFQVTGAGGANINGKTIYFDWRGSK